jgi:hypothetical protein
MQHRLINLNNDLKQLFDEGHVLEIKHGFILVHDIPYLNSQGKMLRGTLVSTLNFSGEQVYPPEIHVMSFIGEFPCNKDGSKISGIEHAGENNLGNGIKVNFSFSNKPKEGYTDYYHKFTQYIKIISAPAKSLDPFITELTHQVIEETDERSVFNYLDVNSSRAQINAVTEKLASQKIAIIGAGGTGSYVLDFIAKTPVQEIHLFDGDTFLQHNAFRTPGAPSLDLLRERLPKTEYLKAIYSHMHRNIFSTVEYISSSNIGKLDSMDFIFLCIDAREIKKTIIEYFESHELNFIDVGMGIQKEDNMLTGVIRTTLSTDKKRDHVRSRISLAEGPDNEYENNIQIADLNALNAAFAVIKWKKLFGFYADFEREYNSSYAVDINYLKSEDNET